MKKLLVLTVALALFSCNSNEQSTPEEKPTEVASNLEQAKSTLDQLFEEAAHWENQSDSAVLAPASTVLGVQLKSLKSKLTEKELKEFNEYSNKRFDEEYPRS